jgi:hypothetical protein
MMNAAIAGFAVNWRGNTTLGSSIPTSKWSMLILPATVDRDGQERIEARALVGLADRVRDDARLASPEVRAMVRVDGADLGVRLRRQEREYVVGGLAFLDLADRRPVGPDAGVAGEGAGLVEREPDIAALGLIELAETIDVNRRGVPTPIGTLNY